MTVIYLSDNKIEIVSKSKNSLVKCASSTDVSKCIYNGTIKDKDTFVAIVKELLKENKFKKNNVTLILNSAQIISRIMKAPEKKPAETLKYISNELSSVERVDESVFGYTLIYKDKATKINKYLANMTDIKQLDDYVHLFGDCGVKLSVITTAHSGIITKISSMKMLSDGASVVSIAEANDITNMLFVNGEYLYSGFVRITTERGTPEFGDEVARAVSNIIQSAKAQQIQDDIKNVWLVSYLDSELQFTPNAVMAFNPTISAQELKLSSLIRVSPKIEDADDYIYPACAAADEKSTDNFLLGRALLEKAKKGTKKTGLTIFLIILLLLLLSGATGYLHINRVQLRNELEDINKVISDPGNIEKEDEYYHLIDMSADVAKRKEALDNFAITLASYPIPDSKINEVLVSAAEGLVNVEVISYDSGSHELKMSTTADDVDKINLFIYMLDNRQQLDVSAYTGYEYDESTKLWKVNVLVALSENMNGISSPVGDTDAN